jgi:Protein  of unknown function (DUF3018)
MPRKPTARTPHDPTGPAPVPARERLRAHRERMRAKGLKPVTIWAYDTSDPDFVAQYQRAARMLGASDPAEQESSEFVDGVYEWPDP